YRTRDEVNQYRDTRDPLEGVLFVALRGARFDAHDFLREAVEKGAAGLLVSEAGFRAAGGRDAVGAEVDVVLAKDTLPALGALARHHRRRLGTPVIALTGSNGKTTTKELLASVFSRVAPTAYSHGNYNSDIGLPMELLRIRTEHRYGIFEMGMNRPGEMRLLAELVEPDVGLITNIGTAHIGMVGSQEAIAREQRQIFAFFTGRQIALIPAGDRYADYLAEGVQGQVVRYSMESAGVSSVESLGIDGSTLVCDEGPIHLRLPGAQMVANAIAVLTAARLLDVPFADIREGVERVEPVFGRSEVIRGEVTIIQDCYNANPESMRAALELLASTTTQGKRVAVLGAMKELGDLTSEAHQEMIAFASGLGLDEVILVGDEFVRALDEHRGRRTATSTSVAAHGYDEWTSVVKRTDALGPGDTVLLKGSRALALERLTPVLSRSEGER
ncbi:MAG: UDP-N-acetylmuramoyl-tripeptide--D-alanyl-D-alanine ligase, partial [Spirochaetota bacterium]